MISIVCPFYNEKDSLPELCDRVIKVLQGMGRTWEIVWVDDGSTDGGFEYLKSRSESAKQFRLIRLDRNYGMTTALVAGLENARGDVLVTLDADLQNPPEEIPRLLNLLDENADIVTGIRAERHDGWLKKLSSHIANRIRRMILGDHIADIGCSLRVFKRETLRSFYPYKGMHRFFLAVAEADGFKIKQVTVGHENRRYGKSKYGLMNRIAGPLWDLIAVKWLLHKKIRYQIKEQS